MSDSDTASVMGREEKYQHDPELGASEKDDSIHSKDVVVSSDAVPASSSETNGPSSSSAPSIPPEEGLRGWLTVLGGFFTLMASFGFLNAVGVFQSYYQEHYLSQYSPFDIAWIFSFQLGMMWFPGPLIGRIVDTYGPLPVLIPCSILAVFSLAMTSLATEYYQIFLAQGVGYGIGAGGIFSSSMIAVGQWFVKRRGMASGIASAGSSLGGVIFPLFLYKLIGEVGFPGAIRYTALFLGVILTIGCLFIRGRLPRRKWNKEAKWFDWSLLVEPKFGFFTFGVFFVMWGLWTPFDFISSFGLSKNFSDELSLALISIVNATSIFGRIIPSYLADRIGHFNIITIATFCAGISVLALWLPFDFAPSHAGVIVYCCVYGTVSGAIVSLLLPCVAKLGPIESIGMRFGTFQLSIGVACLTGLPIAGAILQRQGGETYWGLQTFAIVAFLVGAVLIAGSTHMLARARGTRKV